MYTNLSKFLIVLILTIIIVKVSINVIKTFRSRERLGKAKWWYSFFYYNPEDIRIVLPKENGTGFNINFANPFAKIIVLAFLVFLVCHYINLF